MGHSLKGPVDEHLMKKKLKLKLTTERKSYQISSFQVSLVTCTDDGLRTCLHQRHEVTNLVVPTRTHANDKENTAVEIVNGEITSAKQWLVIRVPPRLVLDSIRGKRSRC